MSVFAGSGWSTACAGVGGLLWHLLTMSNPPASHRLIISSIKWDYNTSLRSEDGMKPFMEKFLHSTWHNYWDPFFSSLFEEWLPSTCGILTRLWRKEWGWS